MRNFQVFSLIMILGRGGGVIARRSLIFQTNFKYSPIKPTIWHQEGAHFVCLVGMATNGNVNKTLFVASLTLRIIEKGKFLEITNFHFHANQPAKVRRNFYNAYSRQFYDKKHNKTWTNFAIFNRNYWKFAFNFCFCQIGKFIDDFAFAKKSVGVSKLILDDVHNIHGEYNFGNTKKSTYEIQNHRHSQ